MRRMQRILLLATLVAIAPVIAGCENFDPDKLDVFHLNKEKKLPGKRVELFPNGVPGVQQGIPPEYMKGYQQQQAAQAAGDTTTGNAAATPGQAGQQTAAVTPVEQVKPKPKPKVKTAEPKAETEKVSQPAPQQQQQQQQMPPWPSSPPQQQPQTGTSAPWPSQPTATAPWPTAPAPGTFSR